MAARDGADGGTGSARRRRERRLRSWLRHEQQSIAAVLATVTHHSFGKVGTASGVLRNMETATRTGNGEEYETHYTAKIRKTPPQGGRPAPLPEVAGWQGRLERHVMEDLGSICPYVQILDLPVPQMEDPFVDNLNLVDAMDAVRLLDRPISEQVIEVPKFIIDDIPARSLVPEPQLAEQLVEVPTVISYSSLQRSGVDIPVPGGGGPSSGLHGFLPKQRSTASPSSRERISERIVEQIVDPVSRGGLHGSSSSHSPAGDEERTDEPGKGVFRTFPQIKKSAKVPPHSRSELPPHSSSWTSAAYALPTIPEIEERRRRLHEEAAQATIQARLFLEQAAKRRKKKKKRKKRVPRTSSHSSRGRARRRQRQWHLSGLPCDVSPRAVFPSVYDRPKMLDIMAGMEQKNSYVLLFFAPCTVFPSLSSGPRCSASWPVWTRRISSGLSPYSALCLVRQRIHAVRQFTEYFIFYVYWWIMDPQVDSRPALFQRLLGSTVNTSLCVSLRGWSSWSQCTSRCVSFVVLRPLMLDIMAGLDQKDNFLRGLVAIPQVQLLDEVVVPVVCTTNAFFQLLITVEVPLVQLIIKVIYIPVAAQRQVSMVLLFSRPSRFHGCSSSTRS